jgi:hypothetical protein
MHVEDKDLVSALSGQIEGSSLRSAVYARVGTALSFSHWLGPLGNYLVARPAARIAAHGIEAKTDIPLDAAVVLGLAPEALHVWAADPMLSQVNDHLGAVPLQHIVSMSAEIDKSWQPLTITVEDGQAFTLEARGDVHGFVATFKELAGR